MYVSPIAIRDKDRSSAFLHPPTRVLGSLLTDSGRRTATVPLQPCRFLRPKRHRAAHARRPFAISTTILVLAGATARGPIVSSSCRVYTPPPRSYIRLFTVSSTHQVLSRGTRQQTLVRLAISSTGTRTLSLAPSACRPQPDTHTENTDYPKADTTNVSKVCAPRTPRVS